MALKKLYPLILFMLISLHVNSHKSLPNQQIGVSGLPFKNGVILFSSSYPQEKPYWDYGYRFGLYYSRKVEKRLRL